MGLFVTNWLICPEDFSHLPVTTIQYFLFYESSYNVSLKLLIKFLSKESNPSILEASYVSSLLSFAALIVSSPN